ncbi:MAG: hypothetical protein JNM17_41235 [Archangium sp.]|nr:hypothetical protein [Archangium sp.]
MSSARAAVLAVVLACLGSCRVGPTIPPGCTCGREATIARDTTYVGDVPSLGGGGSTNVAITVSTSGSVAVRFLRDRDTISQSFSSTLAVP